jgi:hypothetical protein
MAHFLIVPSAKFKIVVLSNERSVLMTVFISSFGMDCRIMENVRERLQFI